MAISPPSDLILDVVRAADPTRVRAATLKLGNTAPAGGPSFASLLAEPAEAPARNVDPATTGSVAAAPDRPAPKASPRDPLKVLQDFEAMTLATMIESTLPDDASAVFGSGTAGDVWKSMLAQQIGREMAEAGGIGIAEQLARHGALAVADGATTGDGAGVTGIGDPRAVASMLADRFERAFVNGLDGDA